MAPEPTLLHWCTIAPMPYFDDLFARLSREKSVSLDVIYLHQGLKDYPLADPRANGYAWRSIESAGGFVRMLRDALQRDECVWLVGGWGSAKYAVLLSCLCLLGRPFWIFNDAPIPEGRSQKPWRRSARRVLLKYWFARATGIIGTGRMAVERLRTMGARAEKLVSIPYPLDEARFTVGRDYDAGAGEPLVIVCSGRLHIRDKRFDLAIEAFARALGRGAEDCILRIAGAGPDEAALRRLASERGVADKVEFLGWLSQDRLAELYAGGHLYLHPTDFEPYGVTVVEALYSGLYTVASDGVGAAVELVREGVNGSVFPCGDLPRLSASLEAAIDAVRSGHVSKAAVRAASLRWKMDTYVDTILERLLH